MAKKYTPLISALVVLYVIVAVLLVITLNKNNGILSYPLDDTFIHMAISKNFAEYGVWGITRYEFSSTTSSPLYTIILATFFYLTGPNIWIPLIVNIIFAALFLILADNLLSKENVGFNLRLIILLAIVLFMPLPILVISGMEHILHTLFAFWFVYLGVKMIEGEKYAVKDQILLIVLAICLGLSRYEGLFTVFALCCLFFLRGKFIYSVALGALAILPIVIFGIISVQNGSYWLPNSVLLKGHSVSLLSMAGIENLYSKPLVTLSHASWLFTLTLLIVGFYIIRHLRGKFSFWTFGQLLIIVFLVSLFFHVEFAAVGWVYRYEAYLMALGIFILGVLWKETIPVFKNTFTGYGKYITVGLFIILIVPIAGRGVSALRFGPKASNNIYMQQYQMGRFLHEYYNGESIAANDIGAINYLADLKLLDIVGLGSIETAKAKREGRFSGKLVENLAKEKGVRIALVYDKELKNSPTNWIKVGEWKIKNNVVGASDVVAFYAVNAEEASVLKKNMQSFTSKLPEGVEVTIL